MVDWADRALEREEQHREQALAAHRRNRPAAQESLHDCEDCGREIPEARRALGGMTRCVPCQSTFERSHP